MSNIQCCVRLSLSIGSSGNEIDAPWRDSDLFPGRLMDLKVKKAYVLASHHPSREWSGEGREGKAGLLGEKFFFFNFRHYSNFPDVAFNLGDEQRTQQCFAWLSMCVCGRSAPMRTFIRFTMQDN